MTDIRRRRFERVLLWQPASGTIVDVPSRLVAASDGPSQSEEYVSLSTGSKEAVRQRNQVQIPLNEEESSVMASILAQQSCPVKGVMLGGSSTDHWMWQEPTRVYVTDDGTSALGMASRTVDLDNRTFYPAIWEGMDLLAGVPWQGTEAQTRDGTTVLRRSGRAARPGYEGPLWGVTSGASVNMRGATTNVSATDPAAITVELPAWGATLRVDTLDGFTLTGPLIEALSWTGTVLASGAPTLTLPDDTWEVRVTIEGATARPRLRVEDSGAGDLRVHPGTVTPDCNPTGTPPWAS